MAKSSKSKASSKAKIEEAEIVEDALQSETADASPNADEAAAKADDTASDTSPNEGGETSDAAQPFDPDVEEARAAEDDASVTTADDAPADTSDLTQTDADGSTPELEDASHADQAPDSVSAAEASAAPADPAEAAPRESQSEPTPVPPVAPAPEKRGGMMPLIIGGLVAGGIGYAVPTFMMPEDTTALDALRAQVASLEASVTEADTRAADAQAGVDAITMPDLAPLEQSASALAEQTSALADQITALDARLTVIEDRPIGESGVTEGDLANLRASLDAQLAQSAAVAAEMERMANMQAEGLANAETEALEAARAATREAALLTVRTALDTGAPFEEAVDDLLELPEALLTVAGSGVTPLAELQEVMPELARTALNAAREAEAESGGASIMAFVQKQVGMRSVTPREGDDPDAVLSRVTAAVAAGDLATALDEIPLLPEAAQAPLADWVSAASARAAATAALSDYTAAN